MPTFKWNISEFKRVRKTELMVAVLEGIGRETVARCNTDLHAAQTRRKQPVKDGYTFHVTDAGTRARLHINPDTARGIAHEAVNHTILKSLPVGKLPTPPPDHQIPRELARSGGLGELLKTRAAKAEKKRESNRRSSQKAAEKRKRKAVFLQHVSKFTP